MDINNNIIYYDEEYMNILIIKNLLIDQQVLVYNSSINKHQVIYSSPFSFGQFTYLQDLQNVFKVNQQVNVYHLFTSLESSGVIYKNFGKKVEGTFRGLAMVKGVKYKKYSLFKHFHNERQLFIGQIKDHPNNLYEGVILQTNGKQQKQCYGEENINKKFVYKGEYDRSLPNGKGILLDL